jgi:lipopolysaccharide export LptBFGC system permease protein LptF
MYPHSGSRAIRRYIYYEVWLAGGLATLILTLLLLYGNMSRYHEQLVQALKEDQILFAELVYLLLPYAFSLALPFGFSLAFIFCVGKWSADREIMALDSLGFSKMDWIKPIILTSLLASLGASFCSLIWAPHARFQFEGKKSSMIWGNFDRLIENGEEFNFHLNEDQDIASVSSIKSFAGDDISRISLIVGSSNQGEWRNLRILLWGQNQQLVGIMHAKRAEVHKKMDQRMVQLMLLDVDVERFEPIKGGQAGSGRFIAFKKWNSPFDLSVSKESSTSDNPKTLHIGRLLGQINSSNNTQWIESALFILNKNSALACSPFFLSFVLLPLGMSKGRKESSANLLWGVLICVTYYLSGVSLAGLTGGVGAGWWINGLAFLIFGLLFLRTSCLHA